MTRARLERHLGVWVTINLRNGRTYEGFLRKLRNEGHQMYSCGSSGPFPLAAVVSVEVP